MRSGERLDQRRESDAMSRSFGCVVRTGLLLALLGCGTEADLEESLDNIQTARPQLIDVRRSLAVTDVEILKRFPLARVMDQLARDANVKGLTGIALFQQWWDTQNPGPGLGRGPHCDDQTDGSGHPTLNGYAYDCRPGPSEGEQAKCASFDDPACAYLPIGLFNRFDLAPENGAHCGEHRIIYAKQTGQTVRTDRNLVIFEGVLPNPFPRAGLQGCRRLIEAWAELSSIDRIDVRAERLERLFFHGSWPFPPVVRTASYGDNDQGYGQIRTNQFMISAAPFVWTLREFKLSSACNRQNRCSSAQVVPVTVKNNPTALLFGDPASDPRIADFQLQLVRDNVASLASTGLSDIAMSTPDAFNSAQSHSSGSAEMNFAALFSTQQTGLRSAIWRALGTLGSDITPEQLVARAHTQTCAGCHQLSNGEDLGGGLFWPASLGFVHVTEEAPETVDGQVRYRISPLLVSSFLPTRQRVMLDYLAERPWRRRGRGRTIGGRDTH
jgi:hypothetical protein